MSGDESTQGEVRPASHFRGLRLLRGIGLALDGRKLVLAVLGLALTWIGWTALDAIFPASQDVTPPIAPRLPLVVLRPSVEGLRDSAAVVAEPLRLPAGPLAALFELGGGAARFLHALLATIWVVIVWGVVGGAIARIAVIEVATGQRIGLVGALRFAVRKAAPLILTPLAPLAGIALMAGGCALVGLLYQIPGQTGATIAGVLAFLPLLAGLVMALLLIGMAAGWPLAVASVATEAEDTFDALSRTFSYVFQRPWLYGLYALLAWLVGTIGLPLVVLLVRLVLHLAVWGLSFGAPDRLVSGAFSTVAADPGSLPSAFHAGWVALVTLLGYGWVYSYVWSAAAQIYLLIRQDVDGTPCYAFSAESAEAGLVAPVSAPPIENVST